MVHACVLALLVGGAGLEPAQHARRVAPLSGVDRRAPELGSSAVELVSVTTDAKGETAWQHGAKGFSEKEGRRLAVVFAGPLSKEEAAKLYADPKMVSPRELTCFQSAVRVDAIFYKEATDVGPNDVRITDWRRDLVIAGDVVTFKGHRQLMPSNAQIHFAAANHHEGDTAPVYRPRPWPQSAASWKHTFSPEGPDQGLPLPGTTWRSVKQRGKRVTPEATKDNPIQIPNPFNEGDGVGENWQVSPDDILYPCTDSNKPEDGLCLLTSEDQKDHECRETSTEQEGSFATSASFLLLLASLRFV